MAVCFTMSLNACGMTNQALIFPPDYSVYNLRKRVAEPGTVVAPPSAPSSSAQKPVEQIDEPDDGGAEESASVEGESDDYIEEPRAEVSKLNSKQCLFCGLEASTLDDNLAHMSKTHSFSVPYQDYLTVDLETLVGYLHLVVYGYGECILCAARRNSAEAIQHHMTAKGHCRFDVASDIADFYNIPKPEFRADEESLRLPSGKLLSHRGQAAGSAVSRATRQSSERRLEPAASPSATPAPTHGSALVPTQGDGTPASSNTQLSRLTRGDQQSLAHLPAHEVRSLLAISARHVDQSRREEKQAKLKL